MFKQIKTPDMQITAIKLTEEEENQIFNTLIEKFNPQKCAESSNEIEINFMVNELIECYATLDLNVEYGEFDSNHQTEAIEVYSNFKINFYHNGEEVKGTENSNIYNLIENHNWIKYF